MKKNPLKEFFSPDNLYNFFQFKKQFFVTKCYFASFYCITDTEKAVTGASTEFPTLM